MNHSRYSLPSRIRGRFARLIPVAAGIWSSFTGITAGQGISLPPPTAGSASADPSASLPRANDSGSVTIAMPPAAIPAARPSLPDPQQLLAGSIRMIARQKSIVAKVRHRATIYDRELIGSGDYAQGPELARLLRYQLRTQVDTHVIEMLQVADGRQLWISTLLKDEPEIQRVDIDRVLAATDAGAVGAESGEPGRQLGLGGLGQLLAAINKDFEFQSVFKSQLGGLNVYGIEGRWKRAALGAFDPKGKGKGDPSKVKPDSLRPHVPDRIVLFLGVDDLFPYRFEYRRSLPAAADGNAKADADVAKVESSKPLLVLEFFEVQFDVPIEERMFQFSPQSHRVADITEKWLAARRAMP